MEPIIYKCDCCGHEFSSGRTRNEAKHCGNCAGYLRTLGVGPNQLKKKNGSRPPQSTQEWYTIDDAADYLRLSRRSIYQLVEDGVLIGGRIGGTRHQRFSKGHLDAVVQFPDAGNEPLDSSDDSVLSQLWDNGQDAEYDRIQSDQS